MHKLTADVSLSAISAGLIAVLVGFASSVAIVFQAAQAAGAHNTEIVSWLLALGVGLAISCIGFSWYYKTPVITAWSTPGAALLAVSLQQVPLAEATAAFMFAGLLTLLLGLSGWFDRIMRWVPMPIAAAMLAGILLRFGLDVFAKAEQAPLVVAVMLISYLLAKRFFARYAILLVLAAGLMALALFSSSAMPQLHWQWPHAVWTAPQFNLSVLLGIGLPLFIVTMTSQNVPGVATLRASGYHQLPISPILTGTGLTTLLLAPFGGYTFNLAAITAAICTNAESHPDPSKRYIAGISAGVFYLLAGLGGVVVVALFAQLPAAFIAALAGIALFSTIGNSLHVATAEPDYREAALITLLITASGLQMAGIASPFWGLIGGMLVHLCWHKKSQ